MENIELLKQTREISLEEKLEINHEKHLKELRISQMRSSVIRKQITEAYEILENIRFDYLGDTAFREKVVMAKKYLEIAFNDYLLNDNYWRASIKSHLNTTPVEFAEQINELPQQSEVVE